MPTNASNGTQDVDLPESSDHESLEDAEVLIGNWCEAVLMGEMGTRWMSPPLESRTEDPQAIHARAYQLEMFEASLQENIIVVVRPLPAPEW